GRLTEGILLRHFFCASLFARFTSIPLFQTLLARHASAPLSSMQIFNRGETPMTSIITSLFAALLAVGAVAPAEPAGKVIIRWHGHSFFELVTTKKTRVVFDPHAIDNYGRQEVAADLVLISHEHNDHTQIDVLKNPDKAKVLHGLKMNGNRLDWNRIDETFRDVRVRSIGVYHDNVSGAQYGKNTIFVVDVDGLRVVHLGDLGHLLNERILKDLGTVDVLMIPVGGV